MTDCKPCQGPWWWAALLLNPDPTTTAASPRLVAVLVAYVVCQGARPAPDDADVYIKRLLCVKYGTS
jgi:hypothetical protein